MAHPLLIADYANPLVPAGYDIAWAIISIAIIAAIVLGIVALVRRSRKRREEHEALRADVDELKRREHTRP